MSLCDQLGIDQSPRHPGSVVFDFTPHSLAISCVPAAPFRSQCSTGKAADRAHFAIDRRGLFSRLHPSGAELVQVAAGDCVETLKHDRLEVVVKRVRGFLCGAS